MKRYAVTGHFIALSENGVPENGLRPEPERSGDVYLASDVDARIAELAQCIDGRVSCAEEKINLRKRIAELELALKVLIIAVDTCDGTAQIDLTDAKKALGL